MTSKSCPANSKHIDNSGHSSASSRKSEDSMSSKMDFVTMWQGISQTVAWNPTKKKRFTSVLLCLVFPHKRLEMSLWCRTI